MPLLLASIRTVGFDARHPRPISSLSGLNADTGQAVWASCDAEPDAWTSQFLGSQPKHGPVKESVLYLSRTMLQSEAPAVDLPAPDAAVLEDAVCGGRATLRLRVGTPPGMSAIFAAPERPAQVVGAMVVGKRVASAHLGGGKSAA